MSERNKSIRSATHERTLSLDAADRRAADAEARTIPASLSSEAEYERWFGREILVHEDEAIDLSRAEPNGLPLLWNHNMDQPIGRVENLRLDGKRLRGTLRFGRNAKAEEVWSDVRDGMLTDMSIGYKIRKWEEQDDDDLIRVTRWQVLEASVVSIPADQGVGINRSNNSIGDTPMANIDGQTTDKSGGPQTVEVMGREFKLIEAKARDGARAEERARLSAIDAIFDLSSVPKTEYMRALRIRAIDKGWSEHETRKIVLEHMADDPIPDLGAATDVQDQATLAAPADQHRGGLRIQVRAGTDEREKWAGIAEKAILVRAGIEQDREIVREVRAAGLHDHSLFDIGTESLRRANVAYAGKSKRDIAGLLLGRAGSHTNADFPSILANVANKAIMKGWDESPTTWAEWCNTGSLPDFKQATIAGLGAFPDLDTIPRSGGPYNEHSMDDIHELARLSTYGALFSIGRQTLIDDDLGALSRSPRRMGEAAARKVNGLAYAVLTNGTSATLTQDSTALFDASTHGNYVTSGAAPSTTTVNAGFLAMATQTPPMRSGETSTAYLNVSPQYLIVPRALETTARILATSTYDPAGTTASVSLRDSPNPFAGRLTVVADALLDAANSAGWYLAAPKNGPVDTVTVYFLNGQQMPYLEEMDHGTSDGITYKVRIDAVAVPLDFRGLYYNDGA